jgi:hypothetical protein
LGSWFLRSAGAVEDPLGQLVLCIQEFASKVAFTSFEYIDKKLHCVCLCKECGEVMLVQQVR